MYQEHLRIIDVFDGELKAWNDRIWVLERENTELKAKLEALHRRQFKSNKKKDMETEGKVYKSSSLQIRQPLKPLCITIQVDLSITSR